MANCQRLLDTLENLRITVMAALELVQANRDEFVNYSTRAEVQKYEELIVAVRILYGHFERECNALELGLTMRDSSRSSENSE